MWSSARLTEYIQRRLLQEKIIWVATVRPNGAPHLTPVWFVWHADRLYICISPTSRKARNLASNPRVALSLEDGRNVVIVEGVAEPANSEERASVAALFLDKYDWDILTDTTYTLLLRIVPEKFMAWGDEAQAEQNKKEVDKR
ncbi:MAG TPA: pyridoxamine 5'-phosphate oxidase [Caldilineae bacterium]|nr:pyridoxamine 5'-phosphate oxidase [Caldilineae bacterium]